MSDTNQSQGPFTAIVVHPDDKVEWLYSFKRREDASQCSYDYCVAKGYTHEDGYRRKNMDHVVMDRYDPKEHTVGLVITTDIKGDYSVPKVQPNHEQ
jgi:hypothetical protein